MSNTNDFDETDVNESLWDFVLNGSLAKIIVAEGKPSYINANQIYVKCNHCNKITNMNQIQNNDI